MKRTLDQRNPDYFRLVRERTENNVILDYLQQTRRLLEIHAPIHTCLDVGCASGYLYFHIQDLIKEYHGLDPSPLFIEYGKEYFKKQGIRNAFHHCRSFETFEPKMIYDALVCLGLFYIFPNFHWHLDEMMNTTRKVIIIRSLFDRDTNYRYVPEMPGASTWTYYNIYSVSEITEFVESRNWKATWHEDDHICRIGGYYETAGMAFPFKFLELTPKEYLMSARQKNFGHGILQEQ
jgi:SAM-dependent methyltransferase